jgi:hypothetical protein
MFDLGANSNSNKILTVAGWGGATLNRTLNVGWTNETDTETNNNFKYVNSVNW